MLKENINGESPELERTFAFRLYNLRMEKQLSQEEVANHVGVTKATVSKWELSENEPKMRVAVKLAELFHVSLDFMIGTSDEREPAKKSFDRLFNSLSPEGQQEVLKYAEFVKLKEQE